MLPLSVLEQAKAELTDFRGSGMSVMEISHRSDLYLEVAQCSELRLRKLLEIPDHYQILFLQGGATAQFAAVPLNLVEAQGRVAYVDTGIWSSKAIEEARRFTGEVIVAASSASTGYTRLPVEEEWKDFDGAGYLHYTSNETIGGLEFQSVPESAGIPLVCDMSSNLLSRPLDVSKFGLIYAGAQKNIGPSGITVVILREDLLKASASRAPRVLDYALQAQNGSMLNTPPTYPWYLLNLVLEWLEAQGGVHAMERENLRKSELLYRVIDQSSLFDNPMAQGSRSRMNIPFRIREASLTSMFLDEAREQGLVNLEGHRSVGGFRASLYNAMPFEGVELLASFLCDFDVRHG
mgnify:CR=1 FL=1